jgi:uncharacterized protein DUF2784
MNWRFLADLVMLLHTAFVVFVVLGLVLVLVGGVRRWSWVRNFWFRLAHLTAIAYVAAEALAGWECPLTTLEKHLRLRGGQEPYAGEFLSHWVHRIIPFNASIEDFMPLHVGFAILVLVAFVLVPPRWPRRHLPGK